MSEFGTFGELVPVDSVERCLRIPTDRRADHLLVLYLSFCLLCPVSAAAPERLFSVLTGATFHTSYSPGPIVSGRPGTAEARSVTGGSWPPAWR